MQTLTGIGLAIAIDILIRVSLVLTAGLLTAITARRNAALRHAILVAGLAAAFLVPAAMPTMQVLPVSRWQFGLLGRVGLDDPAAIAVVGSRPPGEPQHRPASLDHPAPEIIPARRDEARLGPVANTSARSDERFLEPRAPSWLNTPGGQFAAGALLSGLLLGAIIKVTGLGISLMRLRRIVAQARPVAGDRVLLILGLIQRRIPMRHPPRLLESAEVSTPVAAGVIGNYVLLPTGWAGNLHLGETLAVLGHESAHLARRDHRVVILQELLASALWFHPLVHLFNRMLNRVREELCDNYAIAMVNRASYCEALLLLAVGRPGAAPRRHFDVDGPLVARRSSPWNPGRATPDEDQDLEGRAFGDRDLLAGDLRPHCHAATHRVTAQRSVRDGGRCQLSATRESRHRRKRNDEKHYPVFPGEWEEDAPLREPRRACRARARQGADGRGRGDRASGWAGGRGRKTPDRRYPMGRGAGQRRRIAMGSVLSGRGVSDGPVLRGG